MNILTIEDKEIDLIFIKKTLELSGEKGKLFHAGSLNEGLEIISNEEIDCILLDLHLPDGDEYTAFDTIFDEYSHIPIILLTGMDDEEMALNMIDRGAQDYLVKDNITPRELKKSIRFAVNRIKTENKLRDLNATKDKFFSIMAHDLKNPLSIFALATSTLSQEIENMEIDDAKEYLEDLRINADNIYKLLENLLTWSRTQRKKIKFEPDIIDLSFILRNNFDLFKQSANQKNINLSFPKLKESKVYSDSNLINTILRNLVNNAVKYTPEGGKIILKVLEDKDKFTISIIDNGVGMSEHTLENLFRIDVNTSTPGTNNEKGTGLGLIVCKEFVYLMGGDIWAKSELGEGSEFSFTIPKKPFN